VAVTEQVNIFPQSKKNTTVLKQDQQEKTKDDEIRGLLETVSIYGEIYLQKKFGGRHTVQFFHQEVIFLFYSQCLQEKPKI
jgi:hypothetical protein